MYEICKYGMLFCCGMRGQWCGMVVCCSVKEVCFCMVMTERDMVFVVVWCVVFVII